MVNMGDYTGMDEADARLLEGDVGDQNLITLRLVITLNKKVDPIDVSTNTYFRSKELIHSMETIFNDADSQMIKIVAENKPISVSKSLLISKSPVIKRMYDNEWRDTRENVIEITDISYQAVYLLMKFVYSGLIEFEDTTVALDVLRAAHKYEVNVCAELAEDYLCKHVDTTNVVSCLRLADQIDCCNLEKASLEFIFANRKTLSEIDKYDTLESDLMRKINRYWANVS